jgi:hypothetical protein
MERPKRSREHPWLKVLPLDPRDPDVVRAKELLGGYNDRSRDPYLAAEERES